MQRFSRLPVFDSQLDSLVGMVHRFDVFEASQKDNGDILLGDLIKPLHSVPPSQPVSETIEEFVSRREHLFAVVGEYGGLEGIITLEDALETLLGVEIMDEFDSVADMRKLAAEKWAKRKTLMGTNQSED